MRKNFKFKIAAVCGLLAILIGLTGCANNNSNKITVVGSSAMQLLAEQAGNDYRLSHPDYDGTVIFWAPLEGCEDVYVHGSLHRDRPDSTEKSGESCSKGL